ncbi:MAG: UDP-N-acetylmuramoyl-L-alanyl-D-glutamate--2,6-diaminopimelate ligase [Alkalibacterium sp.]|nr:UDP-N-acetylmuramoyl-L-alanyl-D-glutamate--2,6-diaminopimelate ligase [Alkalibacterium sp.]
MKWNEIVNEISDIDQNEKLNDLDITGINEHAGNIKSGELFVAIEGFEKDGHDFIDQAIENGARVIIGQKPLSHLSVPYIQVENSRKVIGKLAANYYGHPSKGKIVVGITGTNGKTTTGLFTTHLLRKAGYSVSFFGTVFNEINGERRASSLTTPSASMIQKDLSESNDEVVVIEVSSQGLQQHRMEGMAFDYGLFTNLQHDHLDYHKTIEDYFLAKKKLFSLLKPEGKAIVNSDDQWGHKLVSLLQEENIEVLTVGETDDTHTTYTFESNGKNKLTINNHSIQAQAPLPGKYNLLNLSMAATVLSDLGHDIDQLEDMIKDLEPIPGRFEVYDLTENVKAVIDYAHTSEALEAVLSTSKVLYPDHTLNHVFGFRGKRDSSKREKMLETSIQYSDHTILTLDDLNGIEEEVMKSTYLKLAQPYTTREADIIMDRTLAVKQVVDHAEGPTLIVLTGKGHENYTSAFNLPVRSDKETLDYLIKYYND